MKEPSCLEYFIMIIVTIVGTVIVLLKKKVMSERSKVSKLSR